ncbi:IS4 family transposase [Bibersteinia trehalosi]|uniref:IS4 family transposase n=1 Tax=Bibersteinia trehalosi TaxID=47735 RepID=A0A3R8LGW7_BIBTR|nr:IS4 family transposase [Bibersteinia trehalosi]RRN06280.1 IS4 family transposase [Bibersteinia trehalosi]
MKLKEILRYIPKEQLRIFALEHHVDHQVKKLSGEVMFYLLLFSALNVRQTSLRTLESIFSSKSFRGLFDKPIKSAKYNSISDRLRTINPDYFEAIFDTVFRQYNEKYLTVKDNILLFDSTIVTLSSKLLKHGLKVGSSNNVKGIKYSIAFSSVPIKSKLFLLPQYSSEDVALKELINDCNPSKGQVLLFDIGIQSRQTFDDFTDAEHYFITRLREETRYKIINENSLSSDIETDSLIIESDLSVKLFNKYNKETKHTYRLIKTRKKSSSEPLYFLTNNNNYSAKEISDLYKKRWEIEVFFKFIKQNLSFSHLLSRNENGMKVEMYITLIAAILLIVYKKENKLSGFKIAKLKSALELESLLIKEIVEICGGDPNKVDSVWAPS